MPARSGTIEAALPFLSADAKTRVEMIAGPVANPADAATSSKVRLFCMLSASGYSGSVPASLAPPLLRRKAELQNDLETP